ncbi:MAG TPA: TIM-barrel domain-containing protein [Rectinemataceae bacterium]|nr:TIM-barrel domain-containing protein [Rectinemataceae bacterium]
MIDIEAAQDGFVLGVDGRKVLAHTRRAPCVEIGVAETVLRQHRGSVRLHRHRAAPIPLRSYRILESAPEFFAVDFDGRLRMAARLEAGRLRISFSLYDAAINFFRIRLAACHDEGIFGCGERFAHLDLKGRRLRLWVEGEREGSGRARADRDASSFPAPVFVSTRSYWCAVDTQAHATIDFSRRTSTLLEAWAVPREIVMGFGADLSRHQAGSGSCLSATALVSDMTAFLGRQALPPSWVHDGAIIGVQGGIEELRAKAELCLRSGAKVAGFLIKDWNGAKAGPKRSARDWTWDSALYPALPRELAALRAKGLRVLASVSPMLPVDSSQYAEASAAGHCVKAPDGRNYTMGAPGPVSGMLDLTSPLALAWAKELLKRELLGIGMSGWVAEPGECLPPDAVLSSGEDASLAHNRWPVLWARANREAIEEAGLLGEALFLSRTGWLGSTRYAMAFWVGDGSDGRSKGAGFAGSIPAGVSAGLSGVGFWQFDVAGALSSARARGGSEGLVRRMEMAAFTPFFVAEDEGGSGSWAGPESLAMLARMTEVFAALKPYHLAVAAEYRDSGLPTIRHPWIHYEGDEAVQGLSRQYLYGRDLMVAPSLGGSEALTGLYLPEDGWVHLWSSREFRGGSVTVESPPGYPAVFYRSESRFASLFDAIRRTARRV